MDFIVNSVDIGISTWAKIKNSCKPNIHSDGNGPRENQGYLHRFRILEHAKGEQTIDHLIHQCLILHKQREIFKNDVLKSGNWPPSKREIISKHLKPFLLFLKSINFELL